MQNLKRSYNEMEDVHCKNSIIYCKNEKQNYMLCLFLKNIQKGLLPIDIFKYICNSVGIVLNNYHNPVNLIVSKYMIDNWYKHNYVYPDPRDPIPNHDLRNSYYYSFIEQKWIYLYFKTYKYYRAYYFNHYQLKYVN